MHSFALVPVAIGLASAVALPQKMGIDIASVLAVPAPTALGPPAVASALSAVPVYNTASAASAAAAAATVDAIAQKRAEIAARDADCAPEPQGAGVPTTPDTDAAFVSNTNYSTLATNAATPQGYELVFQDLTTSTSQAGYMGYYTLNSYDTIKCQQYCDAAEGCSAFNIYVERDPLQNPADACPNPASTAVLRCILYGLPITKETATNDGQWRADFHVVVAGSNGYVKNAPPPSYTNFTGPMELGGAMQPPLYNGEDTYIGMRFFAGPFDPSQCAAACQATTAFDKTNIVAADGSYKACNFFNSYVLSENNAPMGTYCSFYTMPWDRSYATNNGQYDGEGNYYSVSSSYAWTLTTQDSGMIASS